MHVTSICERFNQMHLYYVIIGELFIVINPTYHMSYINICELRIIAMIYTTCVYFLIITHRRAKGGANDNK